MADITRPTNTRWTAIALLLEPFALLLTPAVIITTLIFVIKNCIGFGLSYGSFDWYLSVGPVNQMGHYGGHSMGIVLARHPALFLP